MITYLETTNFGDERGSYSTISNTDWHSNSAAVSMSDSHFDKALLLDKQCA